MSHYRMLARNLLYTGVIRDRQLVLLIGQPQAMTIAVQTAQTDKRLTQTGCTFKNAAFFVAFRVIVWIGHSFVRLVTLPNITRVSQSAMYGLGSAGPNPINYIARCSIFIAYSL